MIFLSKKFNVVEYKNQYTRENYDRISIALPKGMKGMLKEYCDKHNVSMTSVIMDSLQNLFHEEGITGDDKNSSGEQ